MTYSVILPFKSHEIARTNKITMSSKIESEKYVEIFSSKAIVRSLFVPSFVMRIYFPDK